MSKLALVFLFFVFGQCWGALPPDTLKQYNLSEVSVETSRLSAFNIGSKVEKIDSTTLERFKNGNLAELLAQNNFLLVKAYSPGNLATISFRGTSANQTAVLWNGFNIQSTMNGQSDLALLPVNFVNDAKLQFGGGGALFGSGAVGGVIHLNNKPIFDRGFTIGLNGSIGSFSNYQQNISIEISRKRWASSVKIFAKDAKNDYTYMNARQEEAKQQNAAYSMLGLLNENYFRINSNQTINLRYWFQAANRQIPPKTESGSQQDLTHRLTSEWQRQGTKTAWFARAALFSEKITFGTPLIPTVSNIATTIITEVETKITLDAIQSINVGVNNTHSVAQGNNLPYQPNLNRLAVFGSYKIHTIDQKWSASASIREQMSDATFNPITPSAGVEGRLIKEYLQIKANVSRNYRVPTFNELYWKDRGATGNLNLQPEEGWSQDLGVSSTINYPLSTINFSATAFNSYINNWIYWHSVAGVILPENIQSVWSRGIELMGNTQFIIRKNWIISLKINYDYTIATIEKSDQANLIGKQLIYVPYEKAFGNVGVQFKKLKFNYNHAFTGFRFSQEDNGAYLPSFSVGNVQINYELGLKKYSGSVFCQLNNIWNESYQVLASRPMPLFNVQFGISVQFNKPNKNSP